jgi:agmatinase
MSQFDEVRALEQDLTRGRLSRRDFIRRASALGLSASAIAVVLAKTRGLPQAGVPTAGVTAVAAESRQNALPVGAAEPGGAPVAGAPPPAGGAPESPPPSAPLAAGGATGAATAAEYSAQNTGEPVRREQLRGTWAMEREGQLPWARANERAERQKAYGLPPAKTIKDQNNLTLFRRDKWGIGNTGTFMGVPYLEDMRQLGGQHVVFVGVPLDTGTTFRSGTRFGPQALRLISTLGGSNAYNPELGIVLQEALDMVDAGDVQVIPANIEKSFDQIAQALDYVAEREIFPVVLGGDHSIGYPNIRGVAPFQGGNIGIIHFDRHSDLAAGAWDERMHNSPFFHATNIQNAPASNLVQIGIGGWTGSRAGMQVARDRNATVITLEDLDRFGIERIMEFALEVAWKGAKAVWLSFDIDSIDPAFAPGTGTPEPGGLLPREVFRMLRIAAREGLAGMEVVEVSPPFDLSDITALLGGRIIMEVLATLNGAGKLGRRPTARGGEPRPASMSTEPGSW